VAVVDPVEEAGIAAFHESSQPAACERSAAGNGLCCTALGAKAEIRLFLHGAHFVLERTAEISLAARWFCSKCVTGLHLD